jgi:mannose-6-phosphate isomerase-like protein (cupin superfamily)
MKYITLGFAAATVLLGASSQVDIYSPKDLQATKAKLAETHPSFKSESLKNYGNHYTMLAYREATGSAELHEHEADILVFQDGEGTLITGGKLVDAHTEKPGEIRAKSITGGEKHAFGPGYVIHVPAGVPHQVVLGKGGKVSYFVVKVTGQ